MSTHPWDMFVQPTGYVHKGLHLDREHRLSSLQMTLFINSLILSCTSFFLHKLICIFNYFFLLSKNVSIILITS